MAGRSARPTPRSRGPQPSRLRTRWRPGSSRPRWRSSTRITASWEARSGRPTCIKHRTGAISATADGGHTWSAPTTFLSSAATGLTVVPGGLDAWALVGTRLEHSSDGGATWSFRSNVGVTDPSFATATTGSGVPTDHRGIDRRRVVGWRRHMERGPRSLPPGCAGRSLRDAHHDQRRLGRLRRPGRCRVVAPGRLEDDRRRHDVDAGLPRRGTECCGVSLPRRRFRMALALQLRRHLPLHRRRHNLARPGRRDGRQRPRRGRLVHLRHGWVRTRAAGQRLETAGHELRRRCHLVRRSPFPPDRSGGVPAHPGRVGRPELPPRERDRSVRIEPQARQAV